MIKDAKVFALETFREYIVYNVDKIHSKDDLVKIYLKMNSKGYFYKAEECKKMNEVKRVLNELFRVYEKDHSIIEKDLIYFGANRVLQKLENYKKK